MTVYCDIYVLFLFICDRAFLPSLRFFKRSQEREEIIRMESVISEVRVVSMLLVKLLKFLRDCNLKFKKFQTLGLEYAGISIPPSWSSLSSSNPPPRSNSMITSTAMG